MSPLDHIQEFVCGYEMHEKLLGMFINFVLVVFLSRFIIWYLAVIIHILPAIRLIIKWATNFLFYTWIIGLKYFYIYIHLGVVQHKQYKKNDFSRHNKTIDIFLFRCENMLRFQYTNDLYYYILNNPLKYVNFNHFAPLWISSSVWISISLLLHWERLFQEHFSCENRRPILYVQ